ncbi:hypothetical protein Acr_00g0089280 [Actinidia rufa]|uniref:Uncharacterized protein n=1 Tax=Actinidia rufa TaxID=165716 RepID=A0A7J0DWL1_9ERIC|nr:hypothetical protein Acr_00g0089280 [Actinidia rufa]
MPNNRFHEEHCLARPVGPRGISKGTMIGRRQGMAITKYQNISNSGFKACKPTKEKSANSQELYEMSKSLRNSTVAVNQELSLFLAISINEIKGAAKAIHEMMAILKEENMPPSTYQASSSSNPALGGQIVSLMGQLHHLRPLGIKEGHNNSHNNNQRPAPATGVSRMLVLGVAAIPGINYNHLYAAQRQFLPMRCEFLNLLHILKHHPIQLLFSRHFIINSPTNHPTSSN